MTSQKPPNSTGKLTGIPYQDLYEEFAPPWEPLYDHGIDRARIDRAFAKAEELGASDLVLRKEKIRSILAPLKLPFEEEERLSEKLYCFAGHYYSSRFHKLFKDDSPTVRKQLNNVVKTAAKLDSLMSELTPSVLRQVGAATWRLSPGRGLRPELEWPIVRNHLMDLAKAVEMVATEFPTFGRGTTEKVLQGRWLRHSAEAIQQATGREILTKVSDSAGKNYRFEGTEGAVFELYCKTVDRGLSTRTLVLAVRAYQLHGTAGSPSKSSKPAI